MPSAGRERFYEIQDLYGKRRAFRGMSYGAEGESSMPSAEREHFYEI